jgi:predicted TIM-barrel fold metal-dependent hydrolase
MNALSVAMHMPNVYIDLSGWSHEIFSTTIKFSMPIPNLKHKMLFGTDFPLITPERWMKDFETAGFKEEVKTIDL